MNILLIVIVVFGNTFFPNLGMISKTIKSQRYKIFDIIRTYGDKSSFIF